MRSTYTGAASAGGWCSGAVRRGLGLLPVLCSVLVGIGCQKDTRISMIELEERSALPPEQPVVVARDELALTDVQPYEVVEGDVLGITLLGLREDRYEPVNLELRVHDNGSIVFPVVGRIEVAGRTLGGVEEAIVAAHEDVVKDLAVYVQLAGAENTTVLVHGAVAQPGLVQLPENQRNVVYALSQAGGFEGPSSGRVTLYPIRPDREPLAINFKDINDIRRALSGPPLESGDVVKVEAAAQDVVYVTGLVNAPGPVPVPRDGDVSLVRAIAASGGLRDFLEPPEATLWRRLPNGEQVRVKLELDKIMNGEEPDIALAAGDVLDVPHTLDTRFREWVAANIQIGPFGVTAVYDPVADYRARILQNDQDDDSLFRRTMLQSLGTGISNIVLPPVTPPVNP